MTRLVPKMTEPQRATLERMLAAPAGGWKEAGRYSLANIQSDRLVVKLQSRKLGLWGVVTPRGDFLKPKPGRKTMDVSDVAGLL